MIFLKYSFVAQCIVHEVIYNERGVMKVGINKLILKYMEDLSMAYKKALEENRKKQTAKEKRKIGKKCLMSWKLLKKAKKVAACV